MVLSLNGLGHLNRVIRRKISFELLTFKTSKISSAISIKKMKRIDNPIKFRKMKITDEIPIPRGRERFESRRKFMSSFFLKMIIHDKRPNKKDINIEQKSII